MGLHHRDSRPDCDDRRPPPHPDRLAPDPPDPPGPRRLAATARLALPQLDNRLAAAPDPTGAAQLSRAAFLDAAAALVSPTGQLAITAATPAQTIPPVQPAVGLDGT